MGKNRAHLYYLILKLGKNFCRAIGIDAELAISHSPGTPRLSAKMAAFPAMDI